MEILFATRIQITFLNTIFFYCFNVSCPLPKLPVWIRNMSTREIKLHLSIDVKAFINLIFPCEHWFPPKTILLGVKVLFTFSFFHFSQTFHKMPFSVENSSAKICSILCFHSHTHPAFIYLWMASDTSNLLIKGLGIKPVLSKAFPKCWETGNIPALLNPKSAYTSL